MGKSRSILYRWITISAVLFFAAGCTRPSVELSGRPCEEGQCIDGSSCHPETDVCVPAIVVGCASGELCPSSIFAGQSCSPPGAWIPCSDGVTDCSQGCRTCQPNGTWSECTTPDCELGAVWSCSSCSDNCRQQVQNAVPDCIEIGSGEFRCGYTQCTDGFGDVDNNTSNGCECATNTNGVEICDHQDNNCDGRADEGFDLGSICGEGVCGGGVMVCTPDFQGSHCTTMPGGSNDRSTDELCDSLDNDCDGDTDEDFALGGECGVGACSGGIEVCTSNGDGSFCTTMPGGTNDQSSPELCDSIDNDCDDSIDEEFPEINDRCDGTDTDQCSDGFVICNDGSLFCEDDEATGAEDCNGLDDDCNNFIDDNLTPPLSTNQAGVCSGQIKSCGGPAGWLEPNYADIPNYETDEITCDGSDNDCSGETDEGLDAPPATSQAGVCSGAEKVCSGVGGWTEPNYTAIPNYQTTETLCDGLDNDCDGSQDDGYQIGSSCGVGACSGGEWECTTNHSGRVCSTQQGGSNNHSSTEICDAVDNDCDGNNNENLAPIPCDIGFGSGSGQRTCGSSNTAYTACTPLWKRRLLITVAPPTLSTSVSNSPVLIQLNSSRVDYSHIASGGSDIRFISSDHATVLPHEISNWSAGGTSDIWVKLPVIASNTTTTFWMYYSYEGDSIPTGLSEVWPSPYLGVYHLEESQNGTSNSGVYLDSTVNANHATDNISGGSVTGHNGQGTNLAPNDSIVFPLTPSSTYTVELLYEKADNKWSYSALVDIDSPTEFENDASATANTYQLELVLDADSFSFGNSSNTGNDIRFTFADGTPLDYWIESWDSSSQSIVWVSIPTTSGTQLELPNSIQFFYGNPEANSESSSSDVLFQGGLWQSSWSDLTFSHPTTGAQMNALVSSLGYNGTVNGNSIGNDFDSRHSVLGVNCYSDCIGSSNGHDTIVTLEGWLDLPDSGSYTFAINSNDASDFFIGGLDWKDRTGEDVTADRAAYWYSAHTTQSKTNPGNWTHKFTPTMSAGLERFVFRMENINGTYGWGAAWKPPGSSSVVYIPGSSFYYRMRYYEEATASIEDHLTHQLLLTGPWGRNLALRSDSVQFNQGGSSVSDTLDSNDWHYVAAVVESGELTLYINGEPSSATVPNLTVGANNFTLSAEGRTPFGSLGGVDEVRFSQGTRSADWIKVQSQSLGGTLLTYGSPQLTGP